jgi:exopolyphosphatase/guanosine-5'-triphosphate,3'-diphosphate pyrophosphatase
MQNGTHLAAIDLGSNSFRLEIGRFDHGQIQRLEYLKETVRQGNGLDSERNLSPEAMERGLACLARFAERIAGFDKSQVRAVATQTLREAKNRDVFLARGKEILGHRIEVIAGTEEARLIYQGVAHLLPQSSERRLVIDIGGRSTELILGTGVNAHETASFRVGSVAWSMKYFPNHEFTENAVYRAEIAAQAVLEEALTHYPRNEWDVAYGASGTVGAVADVLHMAGWPQGQVTLEGLDWLIKSLLRAGHADRVRLEGLKDDRRSVIGGGVSVLRALMNLLQIDTLEVAQGALRHGVLLDMVQRDNLHSDARDASIHRIARQFNVDAAQSQRVGQVANQLLCSLIPSNDQRLSKTQRKLAWAAQVHEIGMTISHSDFHKHGAYILDNADLLGFSMSELHKLGLLVLGQRGKLKKLDTDFESTTFCKSLLALRLAIILCHARKDPNTHGLTLTCNDSKRLFNLTASKQWMDKHPQSTHLLKQEELSWQKTPWGFVLGGV